MTLFIDPRTKYNHQSQRDAFVWTDEPTNLS